MINADNGNERHPSPIGKQTPPTAKGNVIEP